MLKISEDIGYINALKKVIEIRQQRQKIYGDDWKKAKNYRLISMIMEKAERLERLALNTATNDYEKIEDTLIDEINWSLMLLENILREVNEKQ